MSSPQVIDSQKMEAQIFRFFREQTRETQNKAIASAEEKHQAALAPKDGDVLMTDGEAQRGRMLPGEELRRRIIALNPRLFCERSFADKSRGAVYIKDGVSNLDCTDETYKGARFVASMPWDFVCEHDLVVTKEVPYGEEGKSDKKSGGKIPGWRSVLMRLIKARVISVHQAEKAFQVSRGRESERWALQLR